MGSLSLLSESDQRSLSLFALSGGILLFFQLGNIPELLHFKLSYSVSFGRTTTIVLYGYLYVRVPWLFCEGLLFFFFLFFFVCLFFGDELFFFFFCFFFFLIPFFFLGVFFFFFFFFFFA